VNSIPEDEQLRIRIKDASHKVALQLRLPWGLSKLRERGRHGLAIARGKYNTRVGSFSQFAWRYIGEATRRGGESMRAQEEAESEKRLPPSDERVREALEAFSVQEWTYFIAEFGKEDLNTLRAYLETHRDELERSFGWSKCQSILAAAAER
jgi:hypothetical protein